MTSFSHCLARFLLCRTCTWWSWPDATRQPSRRPSSVSYTHLRAQGPVRPVDAAPTLAGTDSRFQRQEGLLSGAGDRRPHALPREGQARARTARIRPRHRTGRRSQWQWTGGRHRGGQRGTGRPPPVTGGDAAGPRGDAAVGWRQSGGRTPAARGPGPLIASGRLNRPDPPRAGRRHRRCPVHPGSPGTRLRPAACRYRYPPRAGTGARRTRLRRSR